ncbi:hypothetical protein ABT57_20270 [Photobacterium ganghwense]|uniref:Uncharacterized protein n=1 Tax=Photobacterium ganghwense TaxID=320778 RepID=A0A0J1H2U0_9GAMM|nr:hypothetical protein [Photobacterium sp. GSS17]KLV06095.1 hypothetical protein ABT57_20270 [Photobacterium ganghwense]
MSKNIDRKKGVSKQPVRGIGEKLNVSEQEKQRRKETMRVIWPNKKRPDQMVRAAESAKSNNVKQKV